MRKNASKCNKSKDNIMSTNQSNSKYTSINSKNKIPDSLMLAKNSETNSTNKNKPTLTIQNSSFKSSETITKTKSSKTNSIRSTKDIKNYKRNSPIYKIKTLLSVSKTKTLSRKYSYRRKSSFRTKIDSSSSALFVKNYKNNLFNTKKISRKIKTSVSLFS